MDNHSEDYSLYQRLKTYSKSDYYPFHMPGHKRKKMEFINPFQWDITEIDGFDDLHHPEGILKEAMEKAAALYQSDATFFLVNGSSCGILTAISAVGSGGVKNEKFLIARNCHKSVYHGLLLNRLEALFLHPELSDTFQCAGGVSPEQVEAAMMRETDIKGVVITSPTYDGLVSDVKKISEIVHRHDAVLIVDEAHGSHFPFHPFFPNSALELGADAVIQSLHKTLPSLTQTALLHIKGNRIDIDKIRTYLQVYQSSSPSYLLLASIDQCIRYMYGIQGKKDMEEYVNSLQELRSRLSELKRIQLLGENEIGKQSVYDLDRGKIVLSVNGTSITGQTFYHRLQTQYHLQPEMCTGTTVTLITSVNDSKQGFDRLLTAVREIDREIDNKYSFEAVKETAPNIREEKNGKNHEKNRRYRQEQDDCQKINETPVQTWTPAPAKTVMTIAQALWAPHRWSFLEESEGQTAADFVYLYPPGIPILIPGEQITGSCIRQIKASSECGAEIHGILSENGQMSVPVIEGCP